MRAAIADIGSAEADFDPSTDRYAERFRGPAGQFLLDRQTEIICTLTADFHAAEILDIGGGHAQSAVPLLDAGHAVTVLSSTEAAQGQVARVDHSRLALRTGPLLDLPFPDQSFDVVISLRMMAHVGEWRRLIAEMTRVARRAVIFDFALAGGANLAKPLLLWAKKRAEGDTRDFDSIARGAVHEALAVSGFVATREVGQFVLPMVVHRKMRIPAISRAAETALGAVRLDRYLGNPVLLRADRAT